MKGGQLHLKKAEGDGNESTGTRLYGEGVEREGHEESPGKREKGGRGREERVEEEAETLLG